MNLLAILIRDHMIYNSQVPYQICKVDEPDPSRISPLIHNSPCLIKGCIYTTTLSLCVLNFHRSGTDAISSKPSNDKVHRVWWCLQWTVELSMSRFSVIISFAQTANRLCPRRIWKWTKYKKNKMARGWCAIAGEKKRKTNQTDLCERCQSGSVQLRISPQQIDKREKVKGRKKRTFWLFSIDCWCQLWICIIDGKKVCPSSGPAMSVTMEIV